jgi:hypothetical protein
MTNSMLKKTAPKTKEKSQSLCRLMITILAVSIVVGFIIQVMNEGFILDWDGEEARLVINLLLDTKLPDYITNIHMTYEVILGPDFGAYIRFDTEPKHIRAWLATGIVCFEPDLDTLVNHGAQNEIQSILEQETGTSREWWQPINAKQYASGSCDNSPSYRIFIDQTNDRQWIVYIHGWDH